MTDEIEYRGYVITFDDETIEFRAYDLEDPDVVAFTGDYLMQIQKKIDKHLD